MNITSISLLVITLSKPLLYVWLMLLLATCLRFAYSCFRRLDDSAFLRYQEYYVQVTVPPIAVLLPPRFIYRTYVIYR
jgi:hypothetical protein